MGSLVTHACSGVSGEVDVALELLCELVSQKPAEMSQFTVFVKVQTCLYREGNWFSESLLFIKSD